MANPQFQRPYYRPPLVDTAPAPGDASPSPLVPLSARVQDLQNRARIMTAEGQPAQAASLQRGASAYQSQLQNAAEQDMRLRRYQRAKELQQQAQEQLQLAGRLNPGQ